MAPGGRGIWPKQFSWKARALARPSVPFAGSTLGSTQTGMGHRPEWPRGPRELDPAYPGERSDLRPRQPIGHCVLFRPPGSYFLVMAARSGSAVHGTSCETSPAAAMKVKPVSDERKTRPLAEGSENLSVLGPGGTTPQCARPHTFHYSLHHPSFQPPFNSWTPRCNEAKGACAERDAAALWRHSCPKPR